ncbi:MAG: D-glycero-beta-D-manno-heptose 1-phosphate adenylyltransferase [Saprospiraceae bacterium]
MEFEQLIQSSQLAQDSVKAWQQEGQKVVFTNGCFDLLHRGHLTYLAEAKALGQKLVVGLNSDASVARIKGSDRPIVAEDERAFALAALKMVDLVVIFEEDTPLKLIEALQPNILVKGGDYEVHQIVGAEIVMQNGGEVLSLPFIVGYSTTALIDKIQSL